MCLLVVMVIIRHHCERLLQVFKTDPYDRREQFIVNDYENGGVIPTPYDPDVAYELQEDTTEFVISLPSTATSISSMLLMVYMGERLKETIIVTILKLMNQIMLQ